MKSLYLFSVLSLSTLPVYAAEVTDARIEGEELVVNVVHGGGCGTHKYDLQLQGCAESMPVQCKAVLKHTSRDNCEALLHREARFNLADKGISGNYYSNGSLTIKGDNNSSATVRLPRMSDSAPAPRPGRGRAQKPVECVTHTGSILVIDQAAKSISIETTSGKQESYRIVSVSEMSLESYPPVAQTTYKMDDGRSVVTSFRGDEKTGTGNFIRIGGEYSPEFKSCRK